MSIVRDDVKPLTFSFKDDGLVPNNPLPFLVYKAAIDVDNGHPEKTIGACSAPMAGARCGATASSIICITMRRFTRRSASRAATPASGSAATAARKSTSRPAMSPFCPPAPGISACRQARIFPWSAPIRRAQDARHAADARKSSQGAENHSGSEIAEDRPGDGGRRAAGEIVEAGLTLRTRSRS
jgi:hypothetical protein